MGRTGIVEFKAFLKVAKIGKFLRCIVLKLNDRSAFTYYKLMRLFAELRGKSRFLFALKSPPQQLL
ncbi:hypothetical protein BET09_01460 [Pediococcus acidilactici]|nr:hypothetical protein BET09_01460 [Pediococcus acidilactici]